MREAGAGVETQAIARAIAPSANSGARASVAWLRASERQSEEAMNFAFEALAVESRAAGVMIVTPKHPQALNVFDKAGELDRASGYEFEIPLCGRAVPTGDCLEAIRVFNEKRKRKREVEGR